MRNHVMIATSTAALLAAPAALEPAQAQDKIDLTTWDQSLLHRGWRATEFIDTAVYSEGGEELGEVENFYVDAEGQITKVLIETGGVLDIGDAHLAVPWNEVSKWPGEDQVVVPVTEENAPDFSLFEDEPEPGPSAWRATDLIHDLVRLEDGQDYGIIEELIVSEDGKLEAVVVSPDVGYTDSETSAYPWYSRAHVPGEGQYELPYTESEVRELGPFDYQAMEN